MSGSDSADSSFGSADTVAGTRVSASGSKLSARSSPISEKMVLTLSALVKRVAPYGVAKWGTSRIQGAAKTSQDDQSGHELLC